MEHLKHLNDKQKEAALHKNGPILIIAGAGTGKTSTLTHRILNLVKEGIAPSEILAITFTNKAAKEMGERVNELLAKHGFDAGMRYDDARPFIGTFHSLGVHILRAHAQVFGLTKHFTIVDKNSARSLIKEAVKEQGIDSKQFSPDRIAGVISRQKGALITLSQYKSDVGNAYFPMIVSAVWERYERLLARESALDFDDLILKTVILLRDHPEIRKNYQNRWKYIHIDEYQDTNAVQYEMARLLAGEKKLFTRNIEGDKISLIESYDEGGEARAVGEKIKALIDSGTDPEDVAVLYRANFQSRALEEAFLIMEIPYQVLGVRFFER